MHVDPGALVAFVERGRHVVHVVRVVPEVVLDAGALARGGRAAGLGVGPVAGSTPEVVKHFDTLWSPISFMRNIAASSPASAACRARLASRLAVDVSFRRLLTAKVADDSVPTTTSTPSAEGQRDPGLLS